ncbi:MAG: hypothetical protein ACHP7K_12420, partial [Actinomycetales bacterium]
VLEEADHVRDGLKESVNPVFVVVRAEPVAQVGAEEFPVLVDAGGTAAAGTQPAGTHSSRPTTKGAE